jgi:hypothetical protein
VVCRRWKARRRRRGKTRIIGEMKQREGEEEREEGDREKREENGNRRMLVKKLAFQNKQTQTSAGRTNKAGKF